MLIEKLKELYNAALDDVSHSCKKDNDLIEFLGVNLPEIIHHLEQAERMREALEECETKGALALAAIDKFNDENGTFLCGGVLFQFASSVGKARAALNAQKGGE